MKGENLTEAEIEEILDNVDLNGDGQIEYYGNQMLIWNVEENKAFTQYSVNPPYNNTVSDLPPTYVW